MTNGMSTLVCSVAACAVSIRITASNPDRRFGKRCAADCWRGGGDASAKMAAVGELERRRAVSGRVPNPRIGAVYPFVFTFHELRASLSDKVKPDVSDRNNETRN